MLQSRAWASRARRKCTANTNMDAVWPDIAKANLATPVKCGHANESGVDLSDDETAIEVRTPDVEVFGGLVPKPSFEGRPVVPVVHFTKLCDRFAKCVHRATRVCRCREPRRDSAHPSAQS